MRRGHLFFVSLSWHIFHNWENIFLQLEKYFFPTEEKYFSNWGNFRFWSILISVMFLLCLWANYKQVTSELRASYIKISRFFWHKRKNVKRNLGFFYFFFVTFVTDFFFFLPYFKRKSHFRDIYINRCNWVLRKIYVSFWRKIW